MRAASAGSERRLRWNAARNQDVWAILWSHSGNKIAVLPVARLASTTRVGKVAVGRIYFAALPSWQSPPPVASLLPASGPAPSRPGCAGMKIGTSVTWLV